MPEVVCQAPKHRISSGGGFSTFYTQPSWQTASVQNYFNEMALSGQTPIAGYQSDGRGYPDISLAARYYEVRVPDVNNFLGRTTLLAGTSASCPVVAGMISNINAARFAMGKGPVGWINPALYTNSTLFSNDVTEGHNKCAVRECCEHGFYATKGWDPTTGHGSVHYGRMADFFVKLGGPGLGGAPSSSPTQKTLASTPSGSPTPKPLTSTPSGSPTPKPITSTPSGSPTHFYDTSRPSRQATLLIPVIVISTRPSVAPTTQPIPMPSSSPSTAPSTRPSNAPSYKPVAKPSRKPRRHTRTPSQLVLIKSRMQIIEVHDTQIRTFFDKNTTSRITRMPCISHKYPIVF